jgi:hypothetical protein|tara:strand:- start:3049 stop:4029 length:981 start_codon:yes stop_codon:yes gene_type:complete
MENYLLKKGEAFSNKSSTLEYVGDDRLGAGLKSFSSPYKQWVFDQGVPDTSIPQTINIDGADYPKSIGVDPSSLTAWDTDNAYSVRDSVEHGGDAWVAVEPILKGDEPSISDKWNKQTWSSTQQAGEILFIDYNNGRVISSAATESSTINIDYSIKDFNVYVTNETEENLIIESKFNTNSRFKQEENAIPPYDQVIPAIFINNERNMNDPFSLGGEDQTLSDIRCVVMAENIFQLDGALSLFNDSARLPFAALSFEDYPINEFGDAPDFNYQDLVRHRMNVNPSALHYIERVDVSKLSDRITKKIDSNTFVGFIDFEIATYRYPRI